MKLLANMNEVTVHSEIERFVKVFVEELFHSWR